jgi:uncharacterized protein YigE (DUF2233 family)
MKRHFAFWLVASAFASNVRAVEFSAVEVAGKRITVCRVDVRRESLRLFLRDDAGQPFEQTLSLATRAAPFH